MRFRTSCYMAMALAVLAIVCVAPSAAQTKEQPIVKSESAGQFGGLPILPSCATFAVERGKIGRAHV